MLLRIRCQLRHVASSYVCWYSTSGAAGLVLMLRGFDVSANIHYQQVVAAEAKTP
jgi:hypothetical protein